MQYKKLSLLILSTALLANSEVNNFSEVFSEAKVSGEIKYYYIQTDKEHANTADTSAKTNSIGGELSFDTASLYGVSAGVTFMTTNPFLLNDNPAKVDTSLIGKDNGVRGGDATDGFSVLGEAYLAYHYADFDFTLGRKAMKTPLVHSKYVRMMPSTVEGLFGSYSLNEKSNIEVAYLSRFKQRTSDEFIDIIEHALGANTKAVTGSNGGYVAMLGLNYAQDKISIKAYDYYADDFINSLYLDTSYKTKLSDTQVSFAGQYIHQRSIGNADTNLAQAGSLTGGKKINVNAFGFKASARLSDAKIILAYSKVLKDDAKHDSVILPWDGTPLFANSITSNDLFQSIYGSALKSDSIYIGGSQGIKIAYNQKFDSLGMKGFSTMLSYLNTSNSRFVKNQHDYNLVFGYKYDKHFSLVLKGIWVKNNTGADATGAITQLKQLSQYRVITNYKF
ncbi:MAG: OprD family outer membrane porin [Sulfurimonas sp.]